MTNHGDVNEFDERNPGYIAERAITEGALAPSKEWRWECSCGARGFWQGQSESVSHVGLKRHLESVHGGRWA